MHTIVSIIKGMSADCHPKLQLFYPVVAKPPELVARLGTLAILTVFPHQHVFDVKYSTSVVASHRMGFAKSRRETLEQRIVVDPEETLKKHPLSCTVLACSGVSGLSCAGLACLETIHASLPSSLPWAIHTRTRLVACLEDAALHSCH